MSPQTDLIDDQPAALDPRQTTRIEAVHRGFLYQHLYAVGCLLLAEKHEVTSVSVERDEDIELQHAGRTYIQVKTRIKPIIPSDIVGALERFDTLRTDHESGLRCGKVRIPRHPATQSALIWPGIPGPSGHLFHGHPAGQSERSDAGVALLVRVGWRRQFLRPFAH